jgi:hypothetical protein
MTAQRKSLAALRAAAGFIIFRPFNSKLLAVRK